MFYKKIIKLLLIIIIVYSCMSKNNIVLNGIWCNYGTDRIYKEITFYDENIFYHDEFIKSTGNETYKIFNDTLYVFGNDSVCSDIFKPQISIVNDSLIVLINNDHIDTFQRIVNLIEYDVIDIKRSIKDYSIRKDSFMKKIGLQPGISGDEFEMDSIFRIKRDPPDARSMSE